MRAIMAGLLLAATHAGSALAQTGAVTTAQLGDACASTESVQIAYCRGFLVGAGQYHAVITSPPAGRPPVFCLPAGDALPTIEQAQSAFAAWARANPQHAAERAVEGVTRWAASAFPCPAAAAPRGASARR
jgi:hypothetical protein